MIEKLESFLLHSVSDDWSPIGEFDGTIERVAAEEYSRAYVLGVVEKLANERYIEFGAFPGGGRGVGALECRYRGSDQADFGWL
ncbi:hypothetical protein ABZ894_20460 [Nocardia beijingensis]|uniref:hypothetical protein n=1 Tax=Nocardia beijingensis TaxID=95162 RepID=UPI0033C6F9AA